MQLLLGSGGIRTQPRLDLWQSTVDAFLKDVANVLFIPYALKDYDAYTAKIIEDELCGKREIKCIHTFKDPKVAILKAEAIFVGGGNTFRLLKTMQDLGLISIVREQVLAGCLYIGISAGTNLACPTIATTNDMPIVAPQNLQALGLIDFQINPHFFSGSSYFKNRDTYEEYAGETREDRICEYLEENQTPVLALYEGSILEIRDNQAATLYGPEGARLFVKDQEPKDLQAGTIQIPAH